MVENNNDKSPAKAESTKVLPPLNQSIIELNDNDNEEVGVDELDDVKRCEQPSQVTSSAV